MVPLSMSSPITGGVSTAAAMGVGGILVGRVPGDPAAVRAVAEDWKSAARSFWDAADLADYARGATPSFQGATADAFRHGARELTRTLERDAERLEAGVGPLEAYARVLESAIAAADELREFAGRTVLAALGTPAAGIVAAAVVPAIARGWAGILAEVNLAATRTAAALSSTVVKDPSSVSVSGPNKKKDSQQRDGVTKLAQDDIRRIRQQINGGEWEGTHQLHIGDCHLLATLQAYAETDGGRQMLRDNVRWDESKRAFIVTLYDDGKAIEIEVDDYYTEGNSSDYDDDGRSDPDLMNIYERAYGKHFGFSDLDDGGWGDETMGALSGRDGTHMDTRGGSGFLGWPWYDDHKYTDSEWSDIEKALQEGRPVTATTNTSADVDVTIDSDEDGEVEDTDESGMYNIASPHVYTVVEIDDKYVTLRNPWGANLKSGTTDQYETQGLIRITREEYEKRFYRTDIGD